ncbi:DJ-1 [Auriscalpium vulgare]|uniref:DJ-1 n=1 Tax=Auriscalpium vulgare TaxID=40419 RepID=A0ACB8SB02_9AGAM|nr:DJ-1 [Auriscalpium vulgare]
MPSALVLIAHGTEEMEFTITYDTLVRAGVQCTSALIVPKSEKEPETRWAVCSRGVRIVPDVSEAELTTQYIEQFDAVIVPGGAKGAETLSQSPLVQQIVSDFFKAGRVVAMICAGSLAAKTAKLLNQPITSHPSVKSELEKDFDYREDPVIISGNLITSRGPGTAFPFAFALVERLCGVEKRREVIEPMVFPSRTPLC